jgi:hypothetical protein
MRRILIFLLAGCLIFGLFEPTAATTIELIENGGFETGDLSGWSGSPESFWHIHDGWSQETISGNYDVRGLAGHHTAETFFESNSFIIPSRRILTATLSWADRIIVGPSFEDGEKYSLSIWDATTENHLIEVFTTQPDDPEVQPGPNLRSFDVTSIIRPLSGDSLFLEFYLKDALAPQVEVFLDEVSLEVEYLPPERYGSYITLFGIGFFDDYTGGGDDVDAIEFEDSGSFNGPCYVQSATGKARASAATHEVGVFVSGSAALDASCPSARLTGTCGAIAIVEDTIYIHSDTLPEGTPVNIIGRFQLDGNLFLTGRGSDSAWWSYYATLGAPPYLLKVEQQELYSPPLDESVLIEGAETITTRVGDTLPLYIELRAAPGRTAIEPGNVGTNTFDFYGTLGVQIGYARGYEDIIIFSDAGAPIAPPPCANDFDEDGDVDGSDLIQEINAGGPNIDQFAADFGRKNCP